MKSTGIIRRIDELGRIVIPKEIRNKYNIKNGENVEIFIDEEMIGLKKYSTLNKYIEFSKVISGALNMVTKKDVIITDTTNVVDSTLNIQNKNIDNKLYKILEKRKNYESSFKESLLSINKYFYINPLVLNGDIVGSIIIVDDTQINNDSKIATLICSKIFLNYIE